MFNKIRNFLTAIGFLLVTAMFGYLGYVIYNFEQPTPEQLAQQVAERAATERQNLIERMNRMQFLRDTTTGVCFAFVRGAPHGLGLSTIDCTVLVNSDVIEFTSETK